MKKGEVELWEDRRNPPNLSLDELRKVIDRIEKVQKLKWIPRESKRGHHGQNGEDLCFKFETQIQFAGVLEILSKNYFVKGYFFEKEKLKGVTIQSFRKA